MRVPFILKQPIITERSLQAVREKNCYTFEVSREATKSQIKEAVGKIFNVKVLSVHTVKLAGKERRVGRFRREVKGVPRKKAIVKLQKGATIDLFEVKQ